MLQLANAAAVAAALAQCAQTHVLAADRSVARADGVSLAASHVAKRVALPTKAAKQHPNRSARQLRLRNGRSGAHVTPCDPMRAMAFRHATLKHLRLLHQRPLKSHSSARIGDATATARATIAGSGIKSRARKIKRRSSRRGAPEIRATYPGVARNRRSIASPAPSASRAAAKEASSAASSSPRGSRKLRAPSALSGPVQPRRPSAANKALARLNRQAQPRPRRPSPETCLHSCGAHRDP